MLDHVANKFTVFAGHCRGYSPLYERLALGIAADERLLGLAVRTQPGQPPPNMLLGAVHYLLLSGVQHELAAFFPSVTGAPPPPDDPLPAFRAFCNEQSERIAVLVATRRTQTNEVRRCTYLLPAFSLAAQLLGARPLALVEIGASAGLNLRFDSYSYDYGDGVIRGEPGSPVRLVCELHGPLRPPLPDHPPPVAARIGIDLNPVDPTDPDAALWLRALVWPEHHERAALLVQALELARTDPAPLIAGDALELLPRVAAALPADAALCIYHTHVIYQFTHAQREHLKELIAGLGVMRDLCYFSAEGYGADQPRLELTCYRGGSVERQLLAHCYHHGHWIEWVAR